MPRILIGIIASHVESKKPFINFARGSWLLNSPYDHIFIYGQGGIRAPEKDEFFADCPDNYEEMIYKDKALFRYALINGYDFCLRVCDDTFLYPNRLLGLEDYDYAGMLIGKGKSWIVNGRTLGQHCPFGQGHMHGGCGIWLSRKAMERLIADPMIAPTCQLQQAYFDDIWIGEVLQGNLPWGDDRRNASPYLMSGIRMLDDPRFFCANDPRFPIQEGQNWDMAIGIHLHALSNLLTEPKSSGESLKRAE